MRKKRWKRDHRWTVLQLHQCTMFISAVHLCASLSIAMICPLTSTLLWHLPSSSCILSHKDSVSPVGGRAREDLCHAWPDHAGERHQGSDHAVRPGWPRAGGHHWLGQAHPRYKTNDFCSLLFLFCFLTFLLGLTLGFFFSFLFFSFYLSFSASFLTHTVQRNMHTHFLIINQDIIPHTHRHTCIHEQTRSASTHTLNYWWA